MRIERLLPPAQPGRPWTVVLEGGDALRVPEGTVAAFSLYDGLTLEEERLAELKSAAFVATLRERTVALLSARMLSAGQLQEYRRQVPRRYWEQALAELEDPEEFIDAFLARKVQDPGDRKQIKKASDALVRRGFSWRQVSEGVARLRWGD